MACWRRLEPFIKPNELAVTSFHLWAEDKSAGRGKWSPPSQDGININTSPTSPFNYPPQTQGPRPQNSSAPIRPLAAEGGWAFSTTMNVKERRRGSLQTGWLQSNWQPLDFGAKGFATDTHFSDLGGGLAATNTRFWTSSLDQTHILRHQYILGWRMDLPYP